MYFLRELITDFVFSVVFFIITEIDLIIAFNISCCIRFEIYFKLINNFTVHFMSLTDENEKNLGKSQEKIFLILLITKMIYKQIYQLMKTSS